MKWMVPYSNTFNNQTYFELIGTSKSSCSSVG